MKQIKSSKKVALGGIVSSLSLLLMFLTGVFPFAEYALPAFSGIVLITLVIELNKKTAYIAYVAVGILSMLIAPIKESAVLFVFFLGYYPILKSSIEHIKSRVIEWIVKIAMFNFAMVTAYFTMMYVLGMGEILAELNSDFQYGIIAFWLLGNVAFVVYDMALSRMIVMYCERIRPKLRPIIK